MLAHFNRFLYLCNQNKNKTNYGNKNYDYQELQE